MGRRAPTGRRDADHDVFCGGWIRRRLCGTRGLASGGGSSEWVQINSERMISNGTIIPSLSMVVAIGEWSSRFEGAGPAGGPAPRSSRHQYLRAALDEGASHGRGRPASHDGDVELEVPHQMVLWCGAVNVDIADDRPGGRPLGVHL